MDILNRITDIGTELRHSVAQKSGEFVESSKIAVNIKKKEKDIRLSKIEIGTLIYEMYKNGEELNLDLLALCKDIDERYTEIASLELERDSMGLEDLDVEVVDAEVDDEDFVIDDDEAEINDIVESSL